MDMNETQMNESQASESQTNESQIKELHVEEKKTGKGMKIFKTILVCMLLLALAFGVQIVVTFICVFVAVFVQIFKAQGDLSGLQMGVLAISQDPQFLTAMTFVSTMSTSVLFALWYGIGMRKKNAKEQRTIDFRQMFQAKYVIMFLLAALVCYFLALNIVSVLNLISPETVDGFTDIMNQSLGGNQILAFITVVFLAPIGEESLFRGLIFNKLKSVFGIVIAIAVQAVLFGLFHFNLIQGIYVLVLGSVCAYAAYRFHSIVPGIIIHAVNNVMGYLVDLLPDSILNNDWIWVLAPLLPLLLLFMVWKLFPVKNALSREA